MFEQMTKLLKKPKKDFNTALILIISVAIVMGTAYTLVIAGKSFKAKQTVSAKSLPELPLEIKQNQSSYLIYDGYLSENDLKF